MKFNPNLIKKYPEVWDSFNIMKEYFALVKFVPSSVNGKSYYKCTICNRQFLTDPGAYNHLDVKHEKEIIKIIKSHDGIGIVHRR